MHFLALVFVAFTELGLVLSQYSICFAKKGSEIGIYANFQPPSERTEDKDYFFNPPEGKPILKPIVAFLCKSGRTPIDENNDEEFYSTLKSPKYFNITPNKEYLDKNLDLCQYAANNYPITSPKRFDLDPVMTRYTCSKNGLSYIRIHGNMLVAQGIIFQKIEGSVTLTLSTDNFSDLKTYPILVTDAVDTIDWIKSPTKNFPIDNSFSIKLELRNKFGKRVTEGRDANMLVEIGFPIQHMRFTASSDYGFSVADSAFTLSGDDALHNLNDVVLVGQSTEGDVELNGVRLHQTTTGLQLNATLKTRFLYPEGFNRPQFSCKTKIQFDGEFKKKLLTFNHCESVDRSRLSREFVTSGQTSRLLVVEVDLGDSIKKDDEANSLKFRINQIIKFHVKIQDENSNLVAEDTPSTIIPNLTGATCKLGVESKTAVDSAAIFEISICEIAQEITIAFSISGSNVKSKEIKFSVTGNAVIGIFDDLNDKSGKLGSFRKELAEKAVEEGCTLVKSSGFTISTKSLDTKGNFQTTCSEFMAYIEGKWKSPEDRFLGILGFGKDIILKKMKPLLQYYGVSVISISETWKEFLAQYSGKDDIINNLKWNEITYYKVISLLLNSRDWNRIVLVHSDKFPAGKLLAELLMKNISIEQQIVVPDRTEDQNWTEDQKTELKNKFLTIRNGNSRVILSMLRLSLQAKVNPILLKAGVSCDKGFQWVGILEEDIQSVHWKNYEGCKETPTCETYMEGMLLVSAYFNLTNTNIEGKLTDSNGKWKKLSNKDKGEAMLAYDAVTLFCQALYNQIKEKIGTNATSLTKSIRLKDVYGLNGRLISLTENGSREGFVGIMKTVAEIEPEKLSFRWLVFNNFWRSAKSRRRRDTTNVNNILVESPDSPDEHERVPSNEIRSALLRYYISTEGSKDVHNIVPKSENLILRTESIFRIASCDCGALMSPIHSDDYERGYCTGDRICRCKTMGEVLPGMYLNENNKSLIGWAGSKCDIPLCRFCLHGTCVSPETCNCKNGYKGNSCDEAICGSCSLDHGRCTAPDSCECNFGYIGKKCDLSLFLVIFGVVVALILFLIFSLCFYKLSTWRRKRRAIFQVDWLVWWDDVTEMTDETTPKPDAMGPNINIRKVSVKDTTKVWTAQPVVIWKGEKYNIQKFSRSTLDLSSVKIRNEFLTLKNVRHPNLILFVGACLTSPNVCLLTELMPKGTLHQVLVSTTFHVTWHFKFSFLRDICNGMMFLHKSPIHSHGQLKSTTCLVDNKWTCKVSGFGVPSMRQENRELSTDMLSQMLWTAPELLKEVYSTSDIGQGTQEGDVFSFGIIVTECCTHTLPYFKELEILSLEEIIRLLKDFKHPTNKGIKQLLGVHHYDTKKPLRPSIDETEYPFEYKQKQGLKDLIRISTDEETPGRPQFPEILWMLQMMNPMKGGLVENLVDMLERYTLQMEDTIINKLQEIAEQKHRTEDYVNRLLPPTIALHMKEGKSVPPQKHTQVTIFFSDIVGFTALSKQISPMEVVTLLNDLYTTFDDIIDRFEVYKVETVGDAYCVAGGIPDPNPKHASEIATMALHIISAVSLFVIRPMPNKKLQVRIGIHTGACVAGVLGQKKPRYCIFGEDVVIAQNMESGGLAQNIHITLKVKEHLDKTKQFKIIRREKLVNIDPIGDLQTFWLVGKNGFVEPLPSFEQIEPKESIDKAKAH